MHILLYLLFAITALSVISTIAAWICLSAIGTKLSTLERETEKRSMEFDALRKELPLASESASPASVIEESDTNEQQEPEHVTDTIEDTIQIFRNVRGRFNDSQESAPQENATAAPPPENALNPTIAAEATSVEHSEHAAPPPSIPPESAPSDKESEQPAQTFAVNLYSDTTKDADFHSLLKTISELLAKHPQPDICINLSEINFLYEKEMDYLEKINYLITRQGGTLHLTNCDKDLLTLLNRKPALGSAVKL